MKKKLALFAYYIIANRLPSSFFPGGNFFNLVRVSLAKKFLKIGSSCKIQPRVNLGDGNDISIGSFCQINEYVYIESAIIGDYVMIAPNVSIYASLHKYDDVGIPMALQGQTQKNPPIIEDDVWIGRNAVILPGLRIGKGSIVGAGAVVTKDVPEFTVVAGVPAVFIRDRKEK